MAKYENVRRAERTKIELPVVFDNGFGVSRDISASGIYIKTDSIFSLGDTLKFTFKLEYAVPDNPMQFQCVGRVVRVEKIGEEYGIASTIEEMNVLH